MQEVFYFSHRRIINTPYRIEGVFPCPMSIAGEKSIQRIESKGFPFYLAAEILYTAFIMPGVSNFYYRMAWGSPRILPIRRVTLQGVPHVYYQLTLSGCMGFPMYIADTPYRIAGESESPLVVRSHSGYIVSRLSTNNAYIRVEPSIRNPRDCRYANCKQRTTCFLCVHFSVRSRTHDVRYGE